MTSFQKVFEGVQSQSLPSPAVKAPAEAIKDLDLVVSPPLELLGLQDLTQTRAKGLQTMEKTLGILEEYQKAMAEPSIPLKKIHPLLQALSEGLRDIDLLSHQLSPSDPLKEILTRTGIVSAVEIERFNRGDYV